MARKIRHLMQHLINAGFYEIHGAAKGSHRKFMHLRYPEAVTLSGKPGRRCKVVSGKVSSTGT
jgi:predicted RNA binding protein YcfA (HicA-like mRNA interferase family)